MCTGECVNVMMGVVWWNALRAYCPAEPERSAKAGDLVVCFIQFAMKRVAKRATWTWLHYRGTKPTRIASVGVNLGSWAWSLKNVCYSHEVVTALVASRATQ